MDRLILGKTREGEEIRNWKNYSWDAICQQCRKVIETMSHILECEKTKEYLDNLSTNNGTPRVYGLKSLLGDHY